MRTLPCNYRWSTNTAPTDVVVSTAVAKNWLKVETAVTADDTLIDGLVASAVRYVGVNAHRQIAQGTFDLILDDFPLTGEVIIPRAPLVSVSSVSYVDTTGATVALSVNVYDVVTRDGEDFGSIRLKYNQQWPTTRGAPDAVTIRCVCGYSSAPPGVLTAIQMLVGHWYEHREAVITGTISKSLELTIDALLDPIRLHSFPGGL